MDVRPTRSAAEVEAALALREAVFCGEQGVPVEAELDGRDGEALHVVAIDGDRVIGTLRLLFDGPVARLGRMVVDARERGHGVAAALLAEADAQAAAEGAERIVLHAQLTARSVYERAGYVARGGVFVEEGIDHVAMDKRGG